MMPSIDGVPQALALSDARQHPEDMVGRLRDRARIVAAMEMLDEPLFAIVAMEYECEATLREIAERVGSSPCRIGQMRRRAFREMKRRLNISA
jgi:DNA-directed RNA polymerase specialized sigma subunit